jgi:flagellar motor protein MotB
VNQNPLLIAMLLSGLLAVPAAKAEDAAPPAPAQAPAQAAPAATAQSTPQASPSRATPPASPVQAAPAAPQAAPAKTLEKPAEKAVNKPDDKEAQKAEKQERDKADRAEKERVAREKSEKQEQDRAEKAVREKADREAKAQADKQAKADKKAKADEKENAFTPMPLADFVKQPDMKASWGTVFKSELSIPAWIQSMDVDSGPTSQITGADGVNYIVGAMSKANDPYDRLVALFTADRKKEWALGVTIPVALGKDGLLHPKKYASLRWYGRPDTNVRKVFMDYLDKDPSWKM